MKKGLIQIFTLFFILSSGFLFAQEEMVEEPAYISFLAGNVDVDVTPDNNQEDFQVAELDMELGAGALIRTGRKALCEITMPDGSTIKISSGSVFQITLSEIDRNTGKKANRFNLLFGRVRAKVQKFTTTDSEFGIVSGTALAGVRGTEFGVLYDGIESSVLVFEGLVNLGSVTESFEPVLISAGQMSLLPEGGLPEPAMDIPQDVFQDWQTEADKFAAEAGEKIEEAVEQVEKEEVAEKAKGGLHKFLQLNAYVGTITIDNQVYERWVFTPEARFGKLSAGLYLPAIFLPDVGLFGFKEWQNRDEWDFKDLGDGFHDFLIKFYYIQWAQMGDPLYVKVGGIDDFFLGHGFIVDNYSNMLYFPEEITVGMQLNIDADKGGIETMIADFSKIQLVGGRLYFRPAGRDFPLAIGLTGVYDRPKPESPLWDGTDPETGTSVTYATSKDELPNLLFFGADVELPVLSLDMLSMKLYADAAKSAYIYKEVPSGISSWVDAGSFDFIKGLGTAFGLSGKVIGKVKYRGEYRYIINYYEPGLINYLWENERLTYFQRLYNIIEEQNQSSYEDTTTAGILLEGSVSLLKKLEVGLGYENYKRVTSATEEPEPVKKGKLFLVVNEGLIPRTHGSFSYRRQEELENVLDEPFDENTVLDANVVYRLAPLVSLSFSYNRTFQRNEDTGDLDPIDAFGITTIFTFF